MLLSLLGLSDDSTGISDVVFVAIDFENAEGIRKETSSEKEIGIAVLDTGHLDDMISAVSSMYYCPGNTEDSITTYNFATGPVEDLERKSRSFLFGETMRINSEDMPEKIQSCIPQDRKIILVGHGLDGDLIALETLHIDFEADSLLSIMDTFWIARQVSPSEQPYKLRGLLQRLRIDCPGGALHCAGNDANFSLRALLLMAARACQCIDLGLTKESKRARRRERILRKKEMNEVKRERRERGERRGNRQAARQDPQYRAQRAVQAEILNGDGFLEEGDLLRLEDPWRNQGIVATAEVQNEDGGLQEGELPPLGGNSVELSGQRLCC
ncbi:hypothetical protein ZTR_03333 [Talaromyces verruculosus]|nr:hypothetical protein ZTR_03333 [Talaromyces verruculosus]